MQPENSHPTTPLTACDAERQLTLRTVAALLCTGLAIFWGVFALAQFAVIDIADSMGSLTRDSERASGAGLALFALNILAISLTTGLIGRSRIVRFLTEAILVATVATSLLLYPTQTWAQGITRALAHFLNLLAISLAVAANYLPREPRA